MPNAEIITIGTEILLGDTVDTNASFIARSLHAAGIEVQRKTTVGDNIQHIAEVIQEAMARCQVIVTSGGLGPTVDDPTRESVALAVGVEIEFRPELWEQIQSRFRRFGRQPTENNRRQAYVPRGALALENPVGTAPAFIVETGSHTILCLPGVPREMEYLLQHAGMPYLRRHYKLMGIIKTRVLHTSGAGESQIDDLIGDLEHLLNPSVGLTAHSGQVDVRITVRTNSENDADALIAPLENEIRQRLGRWIYGIDQDTLEESALRALEHKGWTLIVVEAGMGGSLIRRLSTVTGPFRGGEALAAAPSQDDLMRFTAGYRQSRMADVALGVAVYPGPERQDVAMVVITPEGIQQINRPYGGPPEYAVRWAVNHSLDVIRNL